MIKIQGSRYPSDFEAKKAMAEIGRKMAEKGYAVATDGSLSVRVGPNAVWMTVDDADKGAMAQDAMVKVDLDGKPAIGARDKALPEEARIHLKLYRDHQEVRAVVHGYPPAAVAMGLSGRGISSAGFTKSLRKLGDVPAIPYTGGDSDAQAVSGCANGGHGVLLRDNGCIAWGDTPSEAFAAMEAMEYYGRVAGLGAVRDAKATPAPLAYDPPVAPVESRAEGRLAGPDATLREVAGGLRLKGVTELVRPGEGRKAGAAGPSAETGRAMETGQNVSTITSDVIHSVKPQSEPGRRRVPGTQYPAAPAGAMSQQSQKVTEKPKEAVMADVVRRAMQGL